MASGVWVACGGVADWLAFATIAEFARLARPDPQGRGGCDGASSSRLLMLFDQWKVVPALFLGGGKARFSKYVT